MSLEDRLYPLLGAYQSLPRRVQAALGTAYRCLPESWRWGSRYREFVELAEACERWSIDAIRQYQTRQLRMVLHHAANYCPYYQAKFARAGFRPEEVREPEDLRRCPTLDKRELIDHLEEFASAEVKRPRRLYMTTGGSTGVPVGFYLQKGVSRPKEQAFLEQMWRRAGYRKGAKLVVIRGHVTTEKTDGSISFYDATRNWLMLSSYHLTRQRMPEYLSAVEKFKPDMIHAYPSAALQMAEFLEAAGQHWRTPVRALLCGSERLTVSQKRLLERAFGCGVYHWYGHSERVVLAGEGARSELLYFVPCYGFVEFGPPDADGLCELIGTSFHNLAMPLIRYRTGDYVRLADPRKNGPLEFPWPAVAEVVGREQEFLLSSGGRRISLTALNMHDRIFDDLYAVQFYQEQPGVAEFRYVPTPNFQKTRLPEIETRIRRKLGDDFVLETREVRDVERTARGKHKWLVSRLAESAIAAPASS
ncbi:MAG: hypothetical protein L0Y58_11850 [Verrucomicrobia subdivision 3 bacterium]|nr:hypothetical protein [Limisphaerales bacterium]